ncbi:unnamed protein product [Absidia cylindrospora]
MNTTKKQQSDPGDFGSDGSENNNGFDGFGQSGEDNDDFAFNKNNSECDDDFDDFGQANGEDYDDFGDFGDFDQAGELGADDNDDDFGDFGDLPEPGFTKDTVPHEDLPLDSVVSTPSDPTLADQYVRLLKNTSLPLNFFFFDRLLITTYLSLCLDPSATNGPIESITFYRKHIISPVDTHQRIEGYTGSISSIYQWNTYIVATTQ